MVPRVPFLTLLYTTTNNMSIVLLHCGPSVTLFHITLCRMTVSSVTTFASVRAQLVMPRDLTPIGKNQVYGTG